MYLNSMRWKSLVRSLVSSWVTPTCLSLSQVILSMQIFHRLNILSFTHSRLREHSLSFHASNIMQSISIFRFLLILTSGNPRFLVWDIVIAIYSILWIISLSVQSVIFIVSLSMVLWWSFVRFQSLDGLGWLENWILIGGVLWSSLRRWFLRKIVSVWAGGRRLLSLFSLRELWDPIHVLSDTNWIFLLSQMAMVMKWWTCFWT